MSIDPKRYVQLWEDFYDVTLARERAEEPRESLTSVKQRRGHCGVFRVPTLLPADSVEDISVQKAPIRAQKLTGGSSE